jgi:hypothetical protein
MCFFDFLFLLCPEFDRILIQSERRSRICGVHVTRCKRQREREGGREREREGEREREREREKKKKKERKRSANQDSCQIHSQVRKAGKMTPCPCATQPANPTALHHTPSRLSVFNVVLNAANPVCGVAKVVSDSFPNKPDSEASAEK